MCGFIGHSVGVHHEFYRFPEDTLQLAKVSRHLLAMEQGNVVARFKGMPLANVDVDMEVDESDIDETEAQEWHHMFHTVCRMLTTKNATILFIQLSFITFAFRNMNIDTIRC